MTSKMTDQRVALLRGVNVGRAKRVAMSDLCKLIEDLGCAHVRALLNSGNVVFASPASSSVIAAQIEAALPQRLNVSARVVGLSAEVFLNIIADNPLLDIATDPSRLMVAVPLLAEDIARLHPLLEQAWAPEVFAVGPRAAYFWCPDGLSESRLSVAIERALKKEVTARNWSTMLKIRDRLEAPTREAR
jgi:uncharacterized protein (DUF1697 family)